MNRDTTKAPGPDPCAAMKAQIVPYLDGELAVADGKRLEAHLAACPACSRELEMHDRIGGALSQACSRGARDEAESAVSAPRFADLVRSRAREAARRQRWLRRGAGLLGAAAAILVAGFLLWPAGSGELGRGNPGDRVARAPAPAEGLLGALDVLEDLDREGVEPSLEVATALLESFEVSDTDWIDLLLPEDVAPEKL